MMKMTTYLRRLSRSLLLRRAIQKNEDGDFPAAEKLFIVKATPAQEERGGSGGSAHLCPAAATVGIWVLRDRIVIFGISEGCTAGLY